MSALEDELAFQLDTAGIKYEREVKALDGRRYRWDFGIFVTDKSFQYDYVRFLVEVQGGTWTRSGHTTHDGLHRDYEKHNLATSAGYRLLYFDADMVHDGTALETIRKAVEG